MSKTTNSEFKELTAKFCVLAKLEPTLDHFEVWMTGSLATAALPPKEPMTDYKNELRQQLAAIEHERWADWQKWVHSHLVESSLNGGDGSHVAFPTELYRQWERQISTPYAELSEAEKASDMEQVDRYWPLIEALLSKRELEARVDEVGRVWGGMNDAGGVRDGKYTSRNLNLDDLGYYLHNRRRELKGEKPHTPDEWFEAVR